MMTVNQLEAALEALLFTIGDSVDTQSLARAIDQDVPTTRKLLDLLRPKIAVISEAADRPDDRPHPYIVSLIKSFVPDVRFTDAVSIPGVVEPEYHESVHIELA